MNTYILMMVFRIWFVEILVSGLNYFVLMNKVYQPRWGELKAHQIGMTTRIIYILIFAYFLDYFSKINTVPEFLLAGFYWLIFVLAFEWIGSFIIRRPVKEILEGWHINKGYMWPFVLMTYLLSPLIVGLIFSPAF